MNIGMEFKGLGDLRKAIAEIGKKVTNKIAKEELRSGAEPIRDAAKANAPEDKGKLKRSIKIRALKAGKGRVGVTVNTGENLFKGKQFYAAFQELGYHLGKRGRSTANLRRNLYKKKRKEGFDGFIDQTVVHSSDKRKFIKGKMFLRRAFDSKAQSVGKKIETRIGERIEQELRK